MAFTNTPPEFDPDEISEVMVGDRFPIRRGQFMSTMLGRIVPPRNTASAKKMCEAAFDGSLAGVFWYSAMDLAVFIEKESIKKDSCSRSMLRKSSAYLRKGRHAMLESIDSLLEEEFSKVYVREPEQGRLAIFNPLIHAPYVRGGTINALIVNDSTCGKDGLVCVLQEGDVVDIPWNYPVVMKDRSAQGFLEYFPLTAMELDKERKLRSDIYRASVGKTGDYLLMKKIVVSQLYNRSMIARISQMSFIESRVALVRCHDVDFNVLTPMKQEGKFSRSPYR